MFGATCKPVLTQRKTVNTKTLIEIIEALSDPDQVAAVDETFREDLRNTELPLVDRAIIDAYLLQQDGKIAEAVEKWRSLANISEGIDDQLAAHAWLSIGILLSKDAQEEALPPYDKALSLKPDHTVVYNNRGATKSLLGQFDAAIADYDKAIQRKPDYADAYYNRGWARSELHQYEAAIADYDETIRLNPNRADAYYNRGVAKSELHQYEAAIADYDEAVRLNPEYTDAYYNRGGAKNEIYHHEAAIVDYDEAI
jgi:tetratricopeptide (TPR) repeat protein